MSYAERQAVTITTAADGTATAYTPVITGRILNIVYQKPGSLPFDVGVDFTITSEATDQTIWTEVDVNASKTVAPRQATHDTAGVASLYAATGEPVEDTISVAKDRVKIAIAQGGNAKTGTFIVIVG